MSAGSTANDEVVLWLLASGRLRVNLATGVVVGRRGRPVGCLTKGPNGGYLRTNIYMPGAPFAVMVHRIVCLAAFGLPPPGRGEVNHKNGVKVDNRSCNLEWSSTAENIRHAIATGLRGDCPSGRGSGHYNARLTPADVRRMRQLGARGLTVRSIGARFGVHPSHAAKVIKGRHWAAKP